jgi:hypothetical protein
MISKLVEWLIYAVLAGLALWFFNDRIEAHYQKPLTEAHAAAAKESAQLNAKRQSGNNQRIESAKDARIKKLETIAAGGKRLADADDRLRDSLRASAAARAEISACVQRADTLDAVQLAIRGFTQRVVQECDRHIADKEAITAAWPK